MTGDSHVSESRLVVGLVGGSHLVNHMYLVLLPPLIPTLTGAFDVSVAAIGLAIGVQGTVTTVLQFPFGYLSDTRGRTLVLAISLGFGALGAVMTALAPTYAWLLVAQVVLGVGIAGHHPAHYPLLAAATKPEHRGRAYSVHGFLGSLGYAIPPAVVTAVVALGGNWRDALLLLAGVGGVYGVACLWTLRARVSRDVQGMAGDEATADRDRPTLRAGLRSFVRTLRSALAAPALVTLTLLALVVSAAGWGVRAYTVELLTGSYAFSQGRANLVVTVMFVTGALAILAGGALSDRWRAEPILLGGFTALVVVAGVLGWGVLPAFAAAAVTVVCSGTISVSRPARSTLTDAISARDDLGKNFALVTVGITGGGAIAPPVFGWLLTVADVGLVFWCIAGLGVLAALLTLRLRAYSGTEEVVGSVADG